ncbi:MAG: tetratricopeptide repeat protein [Parvibaculum sp.]
MKRVVLGGLFVACLWPLAALAGASRGIEANNNCYDQFRNGNMKAAVSFCTTAIESGDLQQDDLVAALINRGVAFRNLGKYQRAVVDYTAALKLAPNDPMIYANRANARRELGELKYAFDDANKAIKLDDTRASSFYTRGAVLEAADQIANARKDYALALKLAPDNEDYQNKMRLVDAKLAQGEGRQSR